MFLIFIRYKQIKSLTVSNIINGRLRCYIFQKHNISLEDIGLTVYKIIFVKLARQ